MRRRAGTEVSALLESVLVNCYVALLRGINVGGNNLIKMSALKACFEGQGHRDVATYIQSGNVLFTSRSSNKPILVRRIEKALSETFAYESRVAVLSREELRRVVTEAPGGFGTRPDTYRYDVIFLKAPLTPDGAMKSMTPRPGVDRVWPGDVVVYSSRLISRASESRLGRIVGTPDYQNMTVRNWNTTCKLLDLLERMPPGT
jgi:uncharacterized protein (DUF1697 family)